jgi:hypothetical protein
MISVCTNISFVSVNKFCIFFFFFIFIDWISIRFTPNSLKDYVQTDPWWTAEKKRYQVKNKEQ